MIATAQYVIEGIWRAMIATAQYVIECMRRAMIASEQYIVEDYGGRESRGISSATLEEYRRTHQHNRPRCKRPGCNHHPGKNRDGYCRPCDPDPKKAVSPGCRNPCRGRQINNRGLLAEYVQKRYERSLEKPRRRIIPLSISLPCSFAREVENSKKRMDRGISSCIFWIESAFRQNSCDCNDDIVSMIRKHLTPFIHPMLLNSNGKTKSTDEIFDIARRMGCQFRFEVFRKNVARRLGQHKNPFVRKSIYERKFKKFIILLSRLIYCADGLFPLDISHCETVGHIKNWETYQIERFSAGPCWWCSSTDICADDCLLQKTYEEVTGEDFCMF